MNKLEIKKNFETVLSTIDVVKGDNKLIKGNGITTKKLKSIGIECYTIEEFYEKYIENK